jgi:uncharacterized protein YbaR (Trm112 family)
MSQPQQDDDIEVFFDTKGPQASSARTPGTYQMAVSAGNGGYFSVGDESGKPKAKLVFTYKYCATVDGTLNDNSDTDIGYTIELAIPWQELGLNGPPADGTVWGFNVINRDRESMDKPADHLASLSGAVVDASGVQNPKLWTKITFTTSPLSHDTAPNTIYCPRVNGHYPIVDGIVQSGEYFRGDSFTLGPPTVLAPAPTKDEEPNVDMSASQAFQQAISSQMPAQTAQPSSPSANSSGETPQPQTTEQAAPPGTNSTDQEIADKGYDVELPGGGAIHVGKMQPPPVSMTPTAPDQTAQGNKGRESKQPGSRTASSGIGSYGPVFPAVGPNLDMSQALRLLDQDRVTPLFMAIYQPMFDPSRQFVDQPMNGRGFWFGSSVQYHMSELRDARRAGVNALLVSYQPGEAADEAVSTLVQAIEDLRKSGQDYPLLGLSLAQKDASYQSVKSFFELVPPEFRAEVTLPDSKSNAPAYVVVLSGSADSADWNSRFADDFAPDQTGLFIAVATSAGLAGADPDIPLSSVAVSPVADPDAPVSARDYGQSYHRSWSRAAGSGADWIVLSSWNDYERGTEVDATREYGEHYADLTQIESLQSQSDRPWRARYLQNDVPAVISPDSLYTVHVRVENTGTLPWRAGEDYGLCYRWYKDGRLTDDSAPKLALMSDVYPGQSTTVACGIVAHNQYGEPLDPGDYTLVFDMVQGDDRWFNYAGDIGLKVHVHVVATGEAIAAKATFIDSTLPTCVQAGATYAAIVTVRNDGSASWNAGQTTIDYVATQPLDGQNAPVSQTGSAVLAQSVRPGEVAQIAVPVTLTGSGRHLFTWTIHTPDAAGHLLQSVECAAADDGASFVLSDVPRNLKTGQETSAQLGIVNLGTQTWKSGDWQLGYHWAYLDGKSDDSAPVELTPIKGPIAPNVATAVTAKFKAPDYPGRYFLVWDVKGPAGRWSSELGGKMHPAACLPLLVVVTPGGGSNARPVDLARLFNTTATGLEGATTGDFNGHGDTIPGEQYPPDGASDTFTNPVLNQIGNTPLYPSGYYAGPGGANHDVAFLYADDKSAPNAVACNGQKIGLPGGFTTIHLLCAATSSAAETGAFSVDGVTTLLTITPWSQAPANAPVGLSFPYRLNAGDIDTSQPTILGDYSIATPNGARTLVLPNDPSIKILAITVAK